MLLLNKVRTMRNYIFKATIILAFFYVSCDNANDLLNQYIKDGPIVYAAKISELNTQSGYYRFRVNIYPAEDVNRSYCNLSWNLTEGLKDSVKIYYNVNNFDKYLGCYYSIIDIPSTSGIQGNLAINAQNVDNFGNKSLMETGSAYIYGLHYISSLINAPVSFSSKAAEVIFEKRVGAVGNLLSYEQNNGSFTREVFVIGDSHPLTDVKVGGIVRTKTRFLITETDIDTLEVAEYLETRTPGNEAIQTLLQFKETSPFALNNKRLLLLNTFQTYSDNLTHTKFSEYMTRPEQIAVDMEHTIPMLYCYRDAFDKVISEVRNTKVKNGTAVVWLLYNMGFVVKTPSGCFGIDIDHRLAEQLEPYLDFLCITHNHGDHYNTKLMEAMNNHGKPVLSNFYKKDGKYVSTVPASYTIGNFTIHTDISDHLADPKLPNFVTVFRIGCGEDAGSFSMLHCGDSGFNPLHFTNVQGAVNMVVLRYGASRENNILGTGMGQVKPDYAVLSHLIELRHQPSGQASIPQTLKNLPSVKCENTILPFWGEKLTWGNGLMY